MKKIIHIITGLNSGGAENMLYKLLKHSNRKEYYHEVISLMDEGVYGEKIEQIGIKVHCLNLKKQNIFSILKKTRSICNNFDVIDTWLYHADIVGFIVAKILLSKQLIWNIRHSNLDKDANKSSTLKIVKVNSIFSKYVDCITYNSNKALENHLELGYSNRNFVVIPNGFELDQFRFDLNDRIAIRKELGLHKEDKAIITVGRWNIQKDYYTLLKALKELKKHNNKFKMIMCGTDLDYSNKELVNLIDEYGLTKNVILLGRRHDVSALLSASDIYVSSSLGESFSNAIGEAMACELHCVVTDVGDSKLMIGNTGEIVESKDYTNLSKKLLNYMYSSNLTRNRDARHRVIDNYEIKSIVKIFEKNLEMLFQFL